MERQGLGRAKDVGKTWSIRAVPEPQGQKAVAACDSYASAKAVRTVLASGSRRRDLHSLPPGFVVITMNSEIMASKLVTAFETYFCGSEKHRVVHWFGDYTLMAGKVRSFLKREKRSRLSAISLLVVDANDPGAVAFARSFQLPSDCVAGRVQVPPAIACFRPSAEPMAFSPLLQAGGVASVINAADLDLGPAIVEDPVRRCCAVWEREGGREGEREEEIQLEAHGLAVGYGVRDRRRARHRVAICFKETLTARIVSFCI